MLTLRGTDLRRAFLLAGLVFVESVQLVIVLGLISSFVPIAADPFNAALYQRYKDVLKPERETGIYHAFIAAGILAQGAVAYSFRARLHDAVFLDQVKRLLLVDGCWVALQLFAIFKMLIQHDSWWARGILYAALAASFLTRVLWRYVAPHVPLFKLPSFKIREELAHAGWWILWVTGITIQAGVGINWLSALSFERQPVFLYAAVMAIMCAAAVLSFKKFNVCREYSRAQIVTEGIIAFLLLSAVFKIIVYGPRNTLAIHAAYVLLAAAVLNKFFWSHVAAAGRSVYAFAADPANRRVLVTLADAGFIVLLIAMVYIPDLEAVEAKMYIGEQFHHMNHFIMAPGWAYVSGCVLNVDVTSRYGVGVPVVLTTLAKLFGGFSYLNIIKVVMSLSIVYYVAAYVFLRLWLKSVLLAAAAMLMLIKLQMFYSLAFPQPFTYPSATPARFMFDIIFMFAILAHVGQQRRLYLWLAAVSCSAAIFYMTETGLYLTAAFYMYLCVHAVAPALRIWLFSSRRNILDVLSCVVFVPVGAFAFFWMEAGAHVWTQQFWYNMFEFSKQFTAGLASGPFYGGLPYGQFWDLLVGVLFPALYVLTILVVGTLCVQGRLPPAHLLVCVLAVYGLGAHHYYIVMSTLNNYYMRSLPFVFVMFYWIRMASDSLRPALRLKLLLGLLLFCGYALWTNHHYLSYPNIFNFSRNPMIDPLIAETLPSGGTYFHHKVRWVPESLKTPLNSEGKAEEGIKSEADFGSDEDLKAYYKKESDLGEDAGLIRSLTTPREPAALISSFETEMLMQAGRKPLFYYFSVFFSRPLAMRTLGNTEIYTTKQLARMIAQLEKASSPYVFMERIFLRTDIPAQYLYDEEGLMALLSYVKIHYRPYRYGKYLVAMKRILPEDK